MAKVRVGLVGCGFVAELHMYAYKRVYGLDAQVTAVAARGEHVLAILAAQERGHQCRVDEAVASCDLLDGADERVVRRLLEDVALGARLEPARE